MSEMSVRLKQKKLTLTMISKQSDVSRSTLSRALNKPVEAWSVRTLLAFAKGLKEPPEKLLADLLSK